MVLRKALLGLAAGSLALGSTVAQASTVELDNLRAPAVVSEAEELAGSLGWVFALLIAIGVIAVVASGDNDDTPYSP